MQRGWVVSGESHACGRCFLKQNSNVLCIYDPELPWESSRARAVPEDGQRHCVFRLRFGQNACRAPAAPAATSIVQRLSLRGACSHGSEGTLGRPGGARGRHERGGKALRCRPLSPVVRP